VYQEGSEIMNAANFLAWTRFPDESGQALAEYSLIITFIAAVCVLAATFLGLAIAAGFDSILPGF
jgi:Flp pilus assembly pilin Flp